MKFTVDPSDQRRWFRALAETKKYVPQTLMDLLRQTAIFYAKSARKDTPGPWYSATVKSMALRPVRKLDANERAMARAKTGRPVNFAVQLWSGTQPSKTPIELYTVGENSVLRKIKYRGAAQVSWSAMLKRLYKTSNQRAFEPPAPGSYVLDRVRALGAAVTEQYVGSFKPQILTENKLGYIAKLRPGIAVSARLSAQNRMQAIYRKKLGPDLAHIWDAGT